MKRIIILLIVLLIQDKLYSQTVNNNDIRTLIVFFDGLRPDYITQADMPNLYAFSKTASVGKKHHSVFPTVTRVNSASYATGSYPQSHGLMGNSVYYRGINPNKALNTGSYDDLIKIKEFTQDNLLTAKSLGEAIHKNGQYMMVFSSGSSGQAFLQNHTISGGAVINSQIILPESLKEALVNELGPIPESAEPNTGQHQWMTQALIKRGLRMDGPLVSAIWFSDPDGAAHAYGIGAPITMDAIKSVDHEFGEILKALEDKGLIDNFNIIVSTDHGFISDVGKTSLTQFLIENGLKANSDSDDVVTAGGAIHLKDKTEANVEKIVKLLQEQEWVGAIFTKADPKDKNKGIIEGTLSFESIHWNHHDRTADILVSANWNDEKNKYGYPGTSFSRGVAGHGGISPYEVNITLLASGPSFKKSFESEIPTSNVDILPTVLALHSIPIPQSVDGRVLNELINGNEKAPLKTTIETTSTSIDLENCTYELILHRTIYGNFQYVDYAKVVRSTAEGK